jgi:2-oxoisovalerate dehydrogenase E1 component
VPREPYLVPFGQAETRRRGRDLTILAVGPSLYPAWEACQLLAVDYGVEAELIDLRSLVPLDLDPVVESVRRTSRLLLVSDAVVRGSLLNSIAAEAQLQVFDYLDGTVTVIGAPNWITPAAELEDAFFPNAKTILSAVDEYLIPLTGWPHDGLGRDARLAAWRQGT